MGAASVEVMYSLPLLPGWAEVNLDPHTRDRSVADVIATGMSGSTGTERQQASEYVHSHAVSAQNGGCGFLGVLAQPCSGAPLLAAVTITVSDRSSADLLRSAERTSITLGPYRAETKTVTLKHVGTAIRTTGIQPITAHRQPVQPGVVTRTFVPFPGGTIIINATSPATAASAPLLELFALLTNGFRLVTLTP